MTKPGNVLAQINAIITVINGVFCFIGKQVAKILTQVSVTKREAEINLDETDFYERKAINKRKKLILEGRDPDEEEAERAKLRRKKQKMARKLAKEQFKLKRKKKEDLEEGGDVDKVK